MRAFHILGDVKRFFRSRLARPIVAVLFALICADPSSAAEPIAVFPATPYDGYIIFESLAVLWLFLIGLIVIIRMKLREIERIQQLGVEQEDRDVPMLE